MRKVEAQTEIKSSPQNILSAFINPKMLNEWWGVERQLIQLKPGGIYSLVWKITESGIGFISTGIIEKYVQNEKLVIKDFVYFNPEKSILGPMSLSIVALPKGNVTELLICQDGYKTGGDWDWYYDAVTQAWPQALETIKDYLEKNS